MKPRYQVSKAAIEIIKSFEGFLERATQLADGRWTIGYGHTRSTLPGAVVSQTDAEALLIYDLISVADAVNTLTFTPLSQNQFDALCAFVYNIGTEAFQGSDVLRYINEGRLLEAAFAMEFWRRAEFHGTSQVVDAIVRRRAAEKTLFLTPEQGWVPVPSATMRPTRDDETLGPALSEPVIEPAVPSEIPEVYVEPIEVALEAVETAPESPELSTPPASDAEVPHDDLSVSPALPLVSASAWPLSFDPGDRELRAEIHQDAPEFPPVEPDVVPIREHFGLRPEPLPELLAEPSPAQGWRIVDRPRVKMMPILMIAAPALALAVGGVFWSGHVTEGEGLFHPFLIGAVVCLVGLAGLSYAAYTFLLQLGYIEPSYDLGDSEG